MYGRSLIVENTLPSQSRIRVETDPSGFTLLVLPTARAGAMRYAVAAFLVFWLGGWAMGWISAARHVVSGGSGATPFLLFWLAGWTLGGFFALLYLWKLLRPSVPETLSFAKPGLIYDTGIQPPAMEWDARRQRDLWKKVFETRKQIQFAPDEIATVRLRDTESDNRLTIDHGTDRIDIGRALTEVEREGLFKLICAEYKI